MKFKKTLAILSAAVLLCAVTPAMNAYAATTKSTQITENFYASELDTTSWRASGGTSVINYGGAIQIKGGDFSTSVGWKGLRENLNAGGAGNGLSGNYTFETTVSVMDGSWFGIYLGVESIAARFPSLADIDGSRGSVLVFSANSITHYVGQGVLATANSVTVAEGNDEAKADAAAHNSVYSLPSRLAFDGTRYCVKIVTASEGNGTKRSENKVDVYIAPEPENRTADTVIEYGDKVATIHYVNTQGYFSFGSMNTGITTFSNIKVTAEEGGNPTVLYQPADDLLTPTVEHVIGSGSAQYYDYEFRVWNSATADYSSMISNGIVGKLQMKETATLSLAQAVSVDSALYSQYDAEFYLNPHSLGDEEYKIILGTEDAKQGVLWLANGEEGTELKDYEGNSLAIPSGTVKFVFKVKIDGSVQVSVNNAYLGTLKVEAVGGELGFESFAGQNVDILNFSLAKYNSVYSTAPSVHADFTLKDPADNRPYISSDELYLSGNASRLVGYDEIAFINARTGSMIATRNQYADYVVKFDLVDVAQNVSTNIVVMSFGKTNMTDDYTASKSLIFVSRGYTDDEYGSSVAGYANVEALSGLTFANGASSIRLSDNFFNDSRMYEGVMVNVMLVVRNRTITLYYKFSTEPESVLSVPRAVCEDVDTYGYFSVGAANISSFSVKNFSLTNLNV